MKLDKKKILGEAEDYFGSKRYSDGTYSLTEECVDLGQVWLDTYTNDYGALIRKSPKEMKKELKKYVKGKVKYSSHNATFIPTFIWMWIAQAIITWVVQKIINNILQQSEDKKYL
tara:strand:+ start:225 stop:569 length:345 start_codon:yes stop_codon:yes gene_type:complete